MFNRALDRGMFDEVHLREVARRVYSRKWDEEKNAKYDTNIWNQLLQYTFSTRRKLLSDTGIVVYIRKDHNLAVVQCQKRENVSSKPYAHCQGSKGAPKHS